MVVLKFGGTSVGSIERIRRVAEIVRKHVEAEGPVCVVVSAMSGETDRLVSLYRELSCDTQTVEYDMLVASGEQASISLLSTALRGLGVKAQPLLGFQAGFLTDGSRGRAKIKSIQTDRITELSEKGVVPIVAGFQGADESGFITTLGRGGSDTSAVALAAALKARRCDIYTDVSGVYTADPRVCRRARKIEKMSFEEMMELASLGAKVLHPRSVEIASKYRIPVRVVSTFAANAFAANAAEENAYQESEGTIVGPFEDLLESPVVTALTTDHNLALITLKNVSEGAEVLDRLFGQLSRENIIVDIIVHSAVREDGSFDLSFSTAKEDTDLVEKSLRAIGLEPSQVETKLSKVSLVGSGMRSHSGVAARVFRTLARDQIPIVCTTTSEIKISCVVPRADADRALEALHDEFCLGAP